MSGIGEHAAHIAYLVHPHELCLPHADVKNTPLCAVGEVSETVGQARLHVGEGNVRRPFREMHRKAPPRFQR